MYEGVAELAMCGIGERQATRDYIYVGREGNSRPQAITPPDYPDVLFADILIRKSIQLLCRLLFEIIHRASNEARV